MSRRVESPDARRVPFPDPEQPERPGRYLDCYGVSAAASAKRNTPTQVLRYFRRWQRTRERGNRLCSAIPEHDYVTPIARQFGSHGRTNPLSYRPMSPSLNIPAQTLCLGIGILFFAWKHLQLFCVSDPFSSISTVHIY